MWSIAWSCVLLVLTWCFPFRDSDRQCKGPLVEMALAENDTDLDTVHVVYASDDKNLPGVLASMTSLSRFLRDPGRCSVHVIVPAASLPRAERLAECFRAAARGLGATPAVRLHALRPLPFDVTSLSKEDWHARTDLLNNEMKYQKLYLHEYLPTVPRALWLDTDTIVRADVGPLYRMRMAHALAAAPEGTGVVLGLRVLAQVREPALLPRLAGLDDEAQFNAGVLLFDLTRYKAEIGRVEALVNNTAGFMVDQTVLNLAFPSGSRDLLDWRWNLVAMASPFRIAKWCVHHARILHWTGGYGNLFKPWHEYATSHPQDYLYRPHHLACSY